MRPIVLIPTDGLAIWLGQDVDDVRPRSGRWLRMAPTCQGPYRCPGCATCTATPAPRRLTATEERRIQRALADHPLIHGPRPLRLVQTDPDHTTYDAPAICDTTMTCMCPRCQTQRSALINAGPKLVKNPWESEQAFKDRKRRVTGLRAA